MEQRVVATLMAHLADCLQRQDKTTKHNQMIELIIALFKQVLAIESDGLLHKKLILKFDEESVLDAFIFLTQDFAEELNKKLALHFLEINYHLFKFFSVN